jgi:uncharacterized protein (TIGR02466 family)
MNNKVINLFSVPIFKTKIELSLKEKEFIKKLKYNLVEFKNGLISDNKNVLNNPILLNINKKIIGQVEEYTKNIIEIDPKISFYFTNSWAMKHREGDYAHAHAHSNSVISGVFYVEVPKNSGNLIFHKNSYNSSNAMISSLALPYKKYNQYNSEEWSIKTEDNLLVLFPSNLTHSVPVSFNKKDRYCIAFNCFIKGTLTTNGVDQLAFG